MTNIKYLKQFYNMNRTWGDSIWVASYYALRGKAFTASYLGDLIEKPIFVSKYEPLLILKPSELPINAIEECIMFTPAGEEFKTLRALARKQLQDLLDENKTAKADNTDICIVT